MDSHRLDSQHLVLVNRSDVPFSEPDYRCNSDQFRRSRLKLDVRHRGSSLSRRFVPRLVHIHWLYLAIYQRGVPRRAPQAQPPVDLALAWASTTDNLPRPGANASCSLARIIRFPQGGVLMLKGASRALETSVLPDLNWRAVHAMADQPQQVRRTALHVMQEQPRLAL